nr:immunoglobulin light chain junction region [Macaca mulatta]
DYYCLIWYNNVWVF